MSGNFGAEEEGGKVRNPASPQLVRKLDLLMGRAGINQRELAERISARTGVRVHQPKISGWLNGEKGEPRLGEALALAREFGVPLEYLADDSIEGPPPEAGASPTFGAPAGVVSAIASGGERLTIEERSLLGTYRMLPELTIECAERSLREAARRAPDDLRAAGPPPPGAIVGGSEGIAVRPRPGRPRKRKDEGD